MDGHAKHVQPAESVRPVLPTDLPVERDLQIPATRSRALPTGLIFGGLAGCFLGALAAAACCWFCALDDLLWPATPIGAAVGFFGGAIIGMRERKARGRLVRPDIATITGVVYGLAPALLVILSGLGNVRGRFSAFALLGAAFVGPMTGLLLGGILDRAYEAGGRKSWGAALTLGTGGILACVGLLWLIVTTDSAPDPKEIAAAARVLILREWAKDAELEEVRIRRMDLVHDGKKVYTGSFDARIGGQIQRFKLRASLVGDTVVAEWQPLEE